ncbi:hypothetical protein [Methanocalculus sp.]|uniref:hypothetical protein n=1 Tax=Methanocalculus sp. TaxID=2004547 RepID=UPI002627688D|nr:hypothetical protein [Methanocalculus sp.]MDG6249865.1 hypothetical protein [Methanocalculus sp.]
MQGEIFLLQGDEELVEMKEKAYDSEDLLQKLLADYPKLLAGNQIDPVNPRRWRWWGSGTAGADHPKN